MSVSVDGRNVPVGVGAVAGILAWAFGYLFTFVLASGRIRDSPVRRLFESLGVEVPTWKVVGWVWYNAHAVDTVSEGLFGGSTNYIGGDGFTPVLYVVPPLLLLGAGLAVGRYAGSDDLSGAALAGVTVTLGYLLLSVVGVFVFVVGGDTRVGPAVGTGIVLAGLFYPLIFGVAGAVVASLTGANARGG